MKVVCATADCTRRPGKIVAIPEGLLLVIEELQS